MQIYCPPFSVKVISERYLSASGGTEKLCRVMENGRAIRFPEASDAMTTGTSGGTTVLYRTLSPLPKIPAHRRTNIPACMAVLARCRSLSGPETVFLKRCPTPEISAIVLIPRTVVKYISIRTNGHEAVIRPKPETMTTTSTEASDDIQALSSHSVLSHLYLPLKT